jgi:branched-subunit amino acid ABC-type transport system permease component
VETLGVRVSLEQLALILIAFVIISTTAWILHATPFGRKIRATVSHPDAARSLGISSSFLHRVIFFGSGLLAGFGGVYMGIDQNVSLTLAFPITIKAYAALIAGGKDNLWGTILCAYGIAMLEQCAVGTPWWFGTYISPSYQSIVALLIIIAILIIKPSGLFSTRARTA